MTKTIRKHDERMANEEVLGPRKTMFVLVIVVGCFAVLWPRILSPLILGTSRDQLQPNQFDREAGCCEVMFATEVAMLELINEVCSLAIGVNGKISPYAAAECRKAVNETCGVDIAAYLKRNENLGKTTKMLLETMKNSNSSCLKEHFGVPIQSISMHTAFNSWTLQDTLKQERPPIRGIGPHPALREKGRAIPPEASAPAPRVPVPLPPHARVRSSPLSVYFELDIKPPPIPGMRPPLGSPGGPVPAPKSSMGFVMPIYTICIIVFFVYTLSKILFKRTGTVPYDTVMPDPHFRRRVFRDDSRTSPDTKLVVTAISGLVAEVQQQMEASFEHNQQRQDVQDNHNRPYSNGTVFSDNTPIRIIASEYKEVSKEESSEPQRKEPMPDREEFIIGPIKTASVSIEPISKSEITSVTDELEHILEAETPELVSIKSEIKNGEIKDTEPILSNESVEMISDQVNDIYESRDLILELNKTMLDSEVNDMLSKESILEFVDFPEPTKSITENFDFSKDLSPELTEVMTETKVSESEIMDEQYTGYDKLDQMINNNELKQLSPEKTEVEPESQEILNNVTQESVQEHKEMVCNQTDNDIAGTKIEVQEPVNTVEVKESPYLDINEKSTKKVLDPTDYFTEGDKEAVETEVTPKLNEVKKPSSLDIDQNIDEIVSDIANQIIELDKEKVKLEVGSELNEVKTSSLKPLKSSTEKIEFMPESLSPVCEGTSLEVLESNKEQDKRMPEESIIIKPEHTNKNSDSQNLVTEVNDNVSSQLEELISETTDDSEYKNKSNFEADGNDLLENAGLRNLSEMLDAEKVRDIVKFTEDLLNEAKIVSTQELENRSIQKPSPQEFLQEALEEDLSSKDNDVEKSSEDIDNATVKVVGMELTAHAADGGIWPRAEPLPVTPVPPQRPPHEAEDVKSIFLETEIPQQSRVLVTDFEDRSEAPTATKHSPLVVSGKMTLSLIQDAPRESPERDQESTVEEFTTVSAVTEAAAEDDEELSDEEIEEEIEIEEVEEEEEEEDELPEVKKKSPEVKETEIKKQ